MKISDFRQPPKKESLTVDKLPFIFQEQYFSIARGLKIKGRFIDPQGNVYSFDQPRKWNYGNPNKEVAGSAGMVPYCYGSIPSEELFTNLIQCNFFEGQPLPFEDIKALQNRLLKISQESEKICKWNYYLQDGPFISQNVYLYKEADEGYERFTLGHSGMIDINHQNQEINDILEKLQLRSF